MTKINSSVSLDSIFEDDLSKPAFQKHVDDQMNRLYSAIVVHDEREAYGWTQKELADKANVPQSTIARIENGDNTSMDTMSKIARAFGKSLRIAFA